MRDVGSAFPPGFLRQQVRRRLVPGAVIKFRAVMDDGKEKEKRWVVVAVNDRVVCCVVNTEMTEFAKRSTTIARHNLLMVQSQHDFMDHDSYVDCTRVREFLITEIEGQLVENTDWMLGTISPGLRDSMVTSFTTSSTIRPHISQPLCVNLRSINYEEDAGGAVA